MNRQSFEEKLDETLLQVIDKLRIRSIELSNSGAIDIASLKYDDRSYFVPRLIVAAALLDIYEDVAPVNCMSNASEAKELLENLKHF